MMMMMMMMMMIWKVEVRRKKKRMIQDFIILGLTIVYALLDLKSRTTISSYEGVTWAMKPTV
jgi:uncharacterized membrane protein YqjE